MISQAKIELLDSLDLDDLTSIHHVGGRPMTATETAVFLTLTHDDLGQYLIIKAEQRDQRIAELGGA